MLKLKIILKYISLFNSKSIDIRWNLINPLPVKIKGYSAIRELRIADTYMNYNDILVNQVSMLIELIGASVISFPEFQKLYIENIYHNVCWSKIREQVSKYNSRTLVLFSNENKWKW